MAAPQFFTPERSKSSRPVRRFTLEQARRALPLVKRIVADIVAAHAQAVKIQQEVEATPKSKERTPLQEKMETTIDRLHDLVDELTDVGCDLKDYQSGLVDFVGRNEGRDVCLCWKLGEDTISYWHEIETGFAGRQPVSKLKED
jgi:hypothetical protein